MDRGELVSDAIVSALIGDELDAMGPDVGAIFDGYPRTAAQAEALDAILAERDRKLDRVIELGVNEEALVERITGALPVRLAARATTTSSSSRRFPVPATSAGGGIQAPAGRQRRNRTYPHGRVSRQDRTDPADLRGARIVSKVDGMAEMDEVTASIEAILAS